MGKMIKFIYVIVTILETPSACAGIFAVARLKDFKNKAVVLNSVYDVMKENLRQPREDVLYRDVAFDPRFQPNDFPQELEYYEAAPSEPGYE